MSCAITTSISGGGDKIHCFKHVSLAEQERDASRRDEETLSSDADPFASDDDEDVNNEL